MIKYKKNIGKSIAGKAAVCCFLFFSCLPAKAQEEDSVSLIEEEQQNSPPSQEEYDETLTEERKKPFFSEKSAYDTITVRQRNLPGSTVKKMQQDDAFWYANAEIEKKEKEQKRQPGRYIPVGQQTWFQTLLWLLSIGGFAAALMWYLAGSNVGLFRKRNRVAGAEEQEIIMEDIFAINYQKQIDKATAQGNYRLAVRLMFLRLLKDMAEKNIIQYKPDKTNLDYLLQLQSTTYYNIFFRLTRHYEYSWYGLFEINEEAYTIIRKEFDQFERAQT